MKKRIHFIGIGGISMHALAIFLSTLGHKVSGSDIKKTDYEAQFADAGIAVQLGHIPDKITDAEIVVINGAIKSDNKELIFAKEKNLVIIDRSDVLAYVASFFPTTIAVAGSHGKTTTTAMLYSILKAAGKRVSCHIGGNFVGSRLALSDEYLVVEACEYNKSFLSLQPNIAAITNIDVDHIDSYGSFENLKEAFRQFLLSAQSRVIYLSNSTSYLSDADVLSCNNSDFYADDIIFHPHLQKTFFNIKKINCKVQLNTLGRHNIKNALLAAKIAWLLNIDKKHISSGLKKFKNVDRRAQLLGKVNRKYVVIDYAHHPTEIENFFDSIKNTYKNPVIVFQPHTFSRTLLLKDKFVEVLGGCKNLVIFKEYSARETKSMGLSAYDLFKLIKRQKSDALYAKDFESCMRAIKSFKNAKSYIFVGAGDIIDIAKKMFLKNG